ncbi:alpha-L-rhamnosidase [Sphingobacterium sp. ML3W]|uniref:alpha-L-rhamnosidase n=1 Tax=Sphingobacterium sp. ML3W TaxID=1538644 RepID=UPI00068BA928|nr:alpha-L-rhamnosidase [Sphingobacterium sp. ML3W]
MNSKFSIKLLFVTKCLLLCLVTSVCAEITPTYLRTEYKVDPFIDELSPRLSWELQSKEFSQYQSAYRILVASSLENLNKNKGDLWDTGEIKGQQMNQIHYAGKTLSSEKKVWWKVKVWDADGKEGAWSTAATWEMAKLQAAEWKAKWIGADLNHLAQVGAYHLPPSPYLRKQVSVTKKVKSARLYISSLGLHNFYINGEKVGSDYFASGWTDYDKRVYYNVYDVTDKVKKGQNAFGATLANGWYAGYLGYALLVGSPEVNRFYGDFPLLKAQVDVRYEDGSKEVFATDRSWKIDTGAVLEADMLQGETYDARKEPANWNKVGFDDKQWSEVQEVANKDGQALQLYPGQPVRVVEELAAKSIKKIAKDKYIVDFGQNFAGIVRLKLKGNVGDSVVLRYGEMLHPDGTLMTENLRKARATDTYVFKGEATEERWSPSFTFHGFQFVEVSGLKQDPDLDFLTGLALSSDLAQVGSFTSDNSMLNQLYSNIVWTQRANYLDIPTDCPQRDERLGWTGDAQVYMRSAIYNADVASFHKKWIRDLNDAQWSNGAFPIYAPMPVNAAGVAAIRATDSFSPGWSEAGIICTYEIFKAYDDRDIVKESLPYMMKFMSFLKRRAQDNVLKEGAFDDVDPKGGFGDWLSIGDKTSPDLVASIYYFYCARLMADMCEAIGEKELSTSFEQEASVMRAGFKKHYLGSDNKLKTNNAAYGDGQGYVEGGNGFYGHTQTAYANAIYSGIFEGEDLRIAGNHLRQLVANNGDKLTTGFLGFKPLLPALSATGSVDKAYKLLLSTEYPSLGYEVANGATSIWERWDSYTQDEGFVHNAAMNSFSHYAFGSVNEWMFEHMVGISALERGYSTFVIKPEIPTGDLAIRQVKGAYHSIAGKIRSEWDYSGPVKLHTLEVPVNTTAYFYVKAPADQIYINGTLLSKSDFVQDIKEEEGYLKLRIGSGIYQIEIKDIS